MAYEYRVEIDGDVVWTDTFDGPATAANFPDEYTDRPLEGVVHLIINDEIVGVQIPLIEEQRAAVAAYDAAKEA